MLCFQTMLVSVLMPSYNYGSFLPRAIESVLHQTLQDFELIIADDGSQDRSWEILQAYAGRYPEKIRITRHKDGQNAGIAATYQLAAGLAQGQILAFLEADDFWHPACLEKKTAALLACPSAGVAASRYRLEGDPRGCLYWHFYQETNRLSLRARKPQDTLGLYLMRNPAASFSHFIMRRSLFEQLPVPARREIFYDWWVLAHASALSDFVFLPERLSTWYIHPASANFGPITREKMVYLKDFSNHLYDSIGSLPMNAQRRKVLDKKRCQMLDYPGFFEGRTWQLLTQEPLYGLRFLCHLGLNRLLLRKTREAA